MLRSRVAGVGSFVPNRVVKNTDLEKFMDTSDEWITKRTGIQKRRWVEEGQTNSDLALAASQEAITAAGIDKHQIDLIIFATLSPDYDFPGTGCFLQEKLGLPGIPALDIRQQCTGFIYGLSIADSFIRTGQYKNVLLVGSEVHSVGLDRTSRGRDVAVLFGDGAGAMLLAATEVTDPKKDAHIYSTHLHADGSYAKELWMPAPGCAFSNEARINQEMIAEGLHFPKMNGKKVFVHAIKRMPETLLACLKQNDYSLEDVDLFVFHQANLRINEAIGESLKIPSEKIYNTIQDYGNTTAATIPLTFHEAIKAGVAKPGMLIATAAFGSGFTWASGLFRY